jgi:transposase-like protein
LLEEHQTPEEILGESGLLKQLTKRLIERALAGELSHHLNHQAEEEKRNSRNGYSKKTVQSNHGEMELSIPRDRQGNFEPVLVIKRQLTCPIDDNYFVR